FTDFYGRTDGYLPELICTGEYAVYQTVILDTYGVLRCELELTPEEDAEFSPGGFFFPEEVTYATVHNEKQGGHLVAVQEGSGLGGAGAGGSGTVNPRLGERYRGPAGPCTARKGRMAYRFSKELCPPGAAPGLGVARSNIGWGVRRSSDMVPGGPPRYRR